MQLLITSLTLSFVFFQASGQAQKTDRDYDELTGPVKVVRTEVEDLRDKTGNPKDNSRQLEKIVTYDRDGRMMEEVELIHFTDACVRSRRLFSYDAQDNRTEAVYWGAGVVMANRENTTQKPATPLLFKQSFKYDRAGRRTEVQDYNTAGKPQSKLLYKYDDKGRVKEKINVYGDGEHSPCAFKTNDQGLPSEEVCNSGRPMGNNHRTTYAYEYDAKGNWIKKVATTTGYPFNGKEHVSKRIIYRQIKYYSESAEGDSVQEPADMIDGIKLVACPKPLVIRKSGGVLQQSAIKRVTPAYPSAAKAAGVSGTVVVEITTDELGKVIAVKTVSGPAELRAVCEEAAKGWEFEPTSLSKVPVRVIGTIAFNFNL